ncbi:uncharacterized protein BXIN_0226 [Babesia sp. Xinjiang]|uniref:uncharacterized protein n=1 Tax=Babesia sp. Xinjiang TaxID=462227 RepID=UPI000A229950|nr:uncharacterized protein BXIN_0226 [Babesia sp. Xinjiang]ORM39863.1 hypothetical protein BXIN_0226 [Babesia sp. Xinjiang]
MKGQFCTAAVCQLCCKATQNGCVNAYTSHANGTLMSNNLYCEQCNCDNPQIGRDLYPGMCKNVAGCGWVGRRFKRIECTSCGVIEAMLQNHMGPIPWLRGLWPLRQEKKNIPSSDDTIVLHYSRYWLPPPIEHNEEMDDDDMSNNIEVILEPYVLMFCLLRRITNCKFRMVPVADELFAGGPMPACYVEDPECYKGEPLRQERLMQYLLLKADPISDEARRLLRSEFRLYDRERGSESPAVAHEDTTYYHSSGSLLPVYVDKHLRYAVLFLIWVYPKISQNVTKSIVLNSTPWLYGHYVYYTRAREIARECAQCGYSNVEFTLKELTLMLKELQRVLRTATKSIIHRPGYWTEGSVFANLALLFSIPCHGMFYHPLFIVVIGIEELLSFHREFYDLKAYCVTINRTYNVCGLQPPFLCGNTFPISHFIKERYGPLTLLAGAWEKITSLPPLNLLY